MRPLDSLRWKDSYVALLTGITPEKRKELWLAGRALFPEMAEYLWEHFTTIEDGPEFERHRDRIGGAMFMFLALVNATMEKPVVSGSLKMLPPARPVRSFPSFGNLPALR